MERKHVYRMGQAQQCTACWKSHPALLRLKFAKPIGVQLVCGTPTSGPLHPSALLVLLCVGVSRLTVPMSADDWIAGLCPSCPATGT